MIVLYAGHRGSGKTTTLVKDAYHFHTLGWDIITNMNTISFADEVRDSQEILDILETDKTNFVLVLDEIQTFIDSRRSMRKRNVSFTYFIQQIRKRNVIILAATQYARRVDIAFREHVDVMARPRYYAEYPVIVCDYYDLTRIEEGFFIDSGYSVRRVVYDPRPVFTLFDTTEVIRNDRVTATPPQETKTARLRT